MPRWWEHHEPGASILWALSGPSTVHHFIYTFADPQDRYFHPLYQMRTLKLREVKSQSSVLIFFFSSFYIYWLVCAWSVMSDSATLWSAARQAPLSMGFSRQKYWSGLPFPPPGIKSMSPALAGGLFTTDHLGSPLNILKVSQSSPWNSSGQNTGVGSLSLAQRIFPIQGSNWGLFYCRWILINWTVREALYQI